MAELAKGGRADRGKYDNFNWGRRAGKMSTGDSGKSKRSKEPTPRDVQKNGQNAISQEDPTLELNQLGTGNHANDLPEPSYNVASLTDQQVAILCDVGDGRKTKPRHRALLTGLIKSGFVEIHNECASTNYKLSAKAQQILAERGVGLNES